MLLKSLLDLPKQAIIALINEQDKRIYVTHSSCVVESIGKLVRQLKDNTHNCVSLNYDREKLRLEVLEDVQNIDALGVRARYWLDLYVSKGYEAYSKINAVKYRLRVEYDDYARVIVSAVNTRKKAYVIGVFRNLGLANQWINNTFKEKDYIIPQYAKNELTKSYLEKYDTPRLGSNA